MKQALGEAAFSFFVLLLCASCSSAGYLAETGIGQWKLFNRARPLKEVLASSNTTEATRHGIEMVSKAKSFAVNDLGLKATRNYETFVQLDSPCVTWAVSASDPLELKEKTWSFPIVGEVPYLGFFDKESADKKARQIEESESPHPDTWVRCVPAFSSLGWFADPLYSSMINGKDHHIVELVVHESLHATIWVGGSVSFNEKLANFIGLEGSLRYMEKEYGAAGAAMVREEVEGEKVFADFMKATTDRYKSQIKTYEDKRAFYLGLAQRYSSYLEEKKKGGLKFTPIRPKLESWNNAALLAYGNYYSDYSVLNQLLRKCSGQLNRFVSWIERKKKESDFKASPEEFLSRLMEHENCP